MSSSNSHSGLTTEISLDISGGSSDVSVVLVHGTLDRAAGMARVARLLPPEIRCVRYDRRGYARSSSLPGPFSIARHIADLVEIVGDKKVVLVGHSFGGNVAMGVAHQLPDQVLGVSTYETPLSWMPWWAGQSAIQAAGSTDDENAAEEFMIRLIGYRKWESLPDKTKDQRRREGPGLVEELTSLREGFPWRPENVLCPLLAGIGTRAAAHHQQGAQWLADNVAGAQKVTFEEVGHGAPITHAKEFADLLVLPHLLRLGVIS